MTLAQRIERRNAPIEYKARDIAGKVLVGALTFVEYTIVFLVCLMAMIEI